MKRFYDIALIAVTNLIGFLSVPICFFSLMQIGVVTEDFFANESQISFQEWSAGILLVWFACLLFSIAALFIQQKERIILMISPAIVPIIYGFSVLFLFGGASF
jgi:hypothetical protein